MNFLERNRARQQIPRQIGDQCLALFAQSGERNTAESQAALQQAEEKAALFGVTRAIEQQKENLQ